MYKFFSHLSLKIQTYYVSVLECVSVLLEEKYLTYVSQIWMTELVKGIL